MAGKTPARAREGLARMEAADVFAARDAEPVWRKIDLITDEQARRGQLAVEGFPYAGLRQGAISAVRMALTKADRRLEARRYMRDFDKTLASQAGDAHAAMDAVIGIVRQAGYDLTAIHPELSSDDLQRELEAALPALQKLMSVQPIAEAPNADDFLQVLVSSLRHTWRKVTGGDPKVTRLPGERGCQFPNYVAFVYADLLGGSEKRDLPRFIADFGAKQGWARSPGKPE